MNKNNDIKDFKLLNYKVNYECENENIKEELLEKLNSIVDDCYYTLYEDLDKINKDVLELHENGRNYTKDEFFDINHYAWFRGENDGGSQEEVIKTIEKVTSLVSRMQEQLQYIDKTLTNNGNNKKNTTSKNENKRGK